MGGAVCHARAAAVHVGPPSPPPSQPFAQRRISLSLISLHCVLFPPARPPTLFVQPTHVAVLDRLRRYPSYRAGAAHRALYRPRGRRRVLGTVLHRGNRLLHRAAL